MLDLSRCITSLILEKPVATGSVCDVEGAALVSVLEGGVEKVKPSTGAAGEKFVGFCMVRSQSIEYVPVVEEGSVPASAPYTLQLKHGAIVSGEIRVYDATDATDLTEGDPGTDANAFSVDYSTGLVTFNAAKAEHDVVIYYRYSPTVAEVKAMYFEEAIGTNAGAVWNRTAVIVPPCEIYTTEYDVTVDWSNATEIRLGPNGRLTTGGSGTVITGARVISVPTVENPYLGIAIA